MSERRYVRSDDVLWRRASGSVVLLSLREPEIFELSGSGVHLWEALATPTTVTSASARLAELFGTSADVVRPDIEQALAELSRRRVVTVVGEA